jgi:uncharacterized membrane protein
MNKNYIYDYLTEDDLNKISDEIKDIEKNTSGEIRLSIRRKRGLFQKSLSPREVAIKEFNRLKMNNTAEKTGVLIFILFNERKFEIVADKGINSKISPSNWESISKNLSEEFKNCRYLDGILNCLRSIGDVLKTEFPVLPEDKNELSDDVIVK